MNTSLIITAICEELEFNVCYTPYHNDKHAYDLGSTIYLRTPTLSSARYKIVERLENDNEITVWLEYCGI